MQNRLKHLAAVIRRVIFIGFSVQIVLGILWMYNAFAGLHSFGEGIVCVGQILLLGMAVFFGAFPLRGKFAAFFTVLSVITFPMVMQCLLKADLRVAAAACMLTAVGCIARHAGPEQGKESRRRKGWIGGACVFLCLGILGYGLTEPKTDMLTRLGSRVAWTTLYNSYERLPQEIRDPMDYDLVAESTYEATGIESVLVPSLEEIFGRQKGRDVLVLMIRNSWEFHRNRILKEILWDEAGYLAAPVILPLQLAGRAYESYSGLNYRQLLQPAPSLGSLYMGYGCLWFVTAAFLRIGLWLIAKSGAEDGSGQPAFGKAAGVLAGLAILGMSLWYTLSGAGKMDYRNALFILCIWLLLMARIRVNATEDKRPAGVPGKEDLPYEKDR